MDDKPNFGEDKPTYRRHTRIWAGLFLLLVGSVLLLDQMGFPLPEWLFNWHTFLIALGLFIGFRSNFRGPVWIILIAVGGVYSFQEYYPTFELHRFLLPGILILIGIMFVLNPHHGRGPGWRGKWHEEWNKEWDKERWSQERWSRKWQRRGPSGFSSSREGYTSEDFIDATTIFSGVHKKIVSKNFRGGDIVTLMGGTEIDLTQADFTGVVRLDVTQIMGGTKIIVPAHWEVRSEVTAVFAGFEDKRQQPTVTNPEKVLIIDGTSIFGGIELKNF
jgi:predicted membrane protein